MQGKNPRPTTGSDVRRCHSHVGVTVTLFLLLLVLLPPLTLAQPCPTRCRSCQHGVADCTSRSLTAPPRAYPRNTRVIDLKGNHIRILGSRTFHRLPALEILKVNDNKINSIRHGAFRNFPNVATVDLSENKINRISLQAIRGTASLRTLSLNRNRIQSLRGIFQNLPNLYQLNLAKNRITSIGRDDLAGLQRVSYLDLRKNRISRIHPQAFSNMTRLRYLFLESNPISRRLPNLVFSSTVLQLVDLSKCRLPSVPKTLPSSLSDYRLGNNRITQVNFTDFSDIVELQLLALNDNGLSFFADGSLSHLYELKEVWLRRNRLVYLPRDLPDNLQRLHLDSNLLREIEPGLFSAESQLEFLTVENNEINRLHPNTFAGMSRLSQINLQGNNLRLLEPSTFSDLPGLQTLLLSNNPLQRISQGAFRNVGNLTHLYLSYISQNDATFQLDENFLTQMPALVSLELMASPTLAEAVMTMVDGLTPDTLFTMPNVTSVDLSFNTLEYVSPKLRQVFPNAQSIPLDGNPLRCTRRLRWLRNWLLTSTVALTRHEELTCDSPPQLYGRELRSLSDNEWGSDDADRSQESLSAQVVYDHHARMARDMPGAGESIRSSSHRARGGGGGSNVSDRKRDDYRGRSRDGTTNGDVDRPRQQKNNNGGVGKTTRKKTLLEEREEREERRKKRLRSKGRRRGRGKGKKNRRRGKKRGKGKGKGKKGGRKEHRKTGRKKREKREPEEINVASDIE